MKDELDHILDWSQSYNLKLNIRKCKEMIVLSPHYHLISSILGSISDYIANKNVNVDHYIVLGDFNCSYLIPNQLFDVFHCFTTECELKNVLHNNLFSAPITYRHNSLNHKSCIDYIFTSSLLYDNVTDAAIQDSGLNLSDHIPIVMKINGNILGVNRTTKSLLQEMK